jgi:hypothetical protein
MENNSENPQNNYPSWVKNLQENSWELELLISGGAIFTLLQLSSLWIEWFETNSVFGGLPGGGLILIFGVLGIEVLKIGFITHLILRAYWISSVCINYVFPDGIKREKISWKKPFNYSQNEDRDLIPTILIVDKLCGTVIFLSIRAAFLMAGIIICIFLLLSIPISINLDFDFLGYILIFILFIYFLDFILLGFLRTIPYLTYILFPFFKFLDIITLRIFFKRQELLFFTNITKWKFIFGVSIFLSFAIIFSYVNLYRSMHWPNIFDKREFKWSMANAAHLNDFMYKDANEDKNSAYYIQSKLIKDNHIELFIRYHYIFDFLMKGLGKEDNVKYLSDLLEVYIDDELQKDIVWHTTWKNSMSKIGITAMIPIKKLESGKYLLGFRIKPALLEKIIKFYSDRPGDLQTIKDEFLEPVIIPFWKDF